MTGLHLASAELRRRAATSVGELTLLALVLIPTLYAGLYLYANSDPYANLDQDPATVVMEGRGANRHRKPLGYGDDLAQELIAQDSSTGRRPRRGTRSPASETAARVAVIPRDFSASLVDIAADGSSGSE